MDLDVLGRLLRNVIFAASAFSVGLATYLAILDGLVFLRTRQRITAAYTLVWGGLALTVGLILWYIVAPIANLGVRPETWTYAVGLAMLAFGTLGVAMNRGRSVPRG